MTVTAPNARTEQLDATRQMRLRKTPLGPLNDFEVSTIEHERLGRVWAPQTTREFFALVAHFAWATRGGWRGQADIDWYLDSSAVRRLREPRPEDDLVGGSAGYLEDLLRRYDVALLERARMAGHGENGHRRLSDLEVLAVLQHHGAATRLMDFSRNAWTALWFACRDGLDRYGLLVGLQLDDVYEVADTPTLQRPLPALLDEAGTRLSMWRPSALSPRIPAQQGFFLWGPARHRPWGSIGVFDEHHEDGSAAGSTAAGKAPAAEAQAVEAPVGETVPGFICIAVAPELKHDASLIWTGMFGIEPETMFPDLDGFAQAHGPMAPAEALGIYRDAPGPPDDAPLLNTEADDVEFGDPEL